MTKRLVLETSAVIAGILLELDEEPITELASLLGCWGPDQGSVFVI